jgi:hypothetical protein
MQGNFDVGREILKWIAIATMTVDHVGAILYPTIEVLRIIGRISFPLFSYLIALGVETTRNVKNYFVRLFIFAFISQIPFSLAVGTGMFDYLNIFFTLSLGVLFIHSLKKRSLLILIPILASFLNVLNYLNFDYGVYGILLIGSMDILREDTELGIALVLLLNVSFLTQGSIQILSLLALPIILLYNNGLLKITKESKGKNPYPTWRKYFFYIYYPLHLTLLYLIKLYYFQ